MINASSRPFRLLIGGQDLSRYFKSLECQDTDNRQGLIDQRGRLILEQSDADFVLNDRVNPFWKRGLPIELDVLHPDGDLVRFKTLRVIQPAYDPALLRQSLDIGCVLRLIDYPIPRNCDTIGLDVSLGGGKSKTAIINDFLEYFGLPPMNGDLPGSINYPILGGNDSLASLAGRLAYSAGFALWVNQQGEVVPIYRGLSVSY